MFGGLDILLHAFPLILKAMPNAKLLVVGEFYDKPEFYTDIVQQNGTADRVKFVNQLVPNEEVGKYFAAADVMVQPYRSATQSGILNVAYSFGVPVVTRVGGLEEYVTDGLPVSSHHPNHRKSLQQRSFASTHSARQSISKQISMIEYPAALFTGLPMSLIGSLNHNCRLSRMIIAT